MILGRGEAGQDPGRNTPVAVIGSTLVLSAATIKNDSAAPAPDGAASGLALQRF